MSEKVVWQLLQQYATVVGAPGIAPHDLRRTCARLCRAAGGELEQIQFLLGHASVQTTERYPAVSRTVHGASNLQVPHRLLILGLDIRQTQVLVDFQALLAAMA